jgi:hypothetical protein
VQPLRRFYYLLDSRRSFVLARHRSREHHQVNEHESQIVKPNLKREHVAIFCRLRAGAHSFEHQLRLPRCGLSLAKAAFNPLACLVRPAHQTFSAKARTGAPHAMINVRPFDHRMEAP